jgi:hypothetical protein
MIIPDLGISIDLAIKAAKVDEIPPKQATFFSLVAPGIKGILPPIFTAPRPPRRARPETLWPTRKLARSLARKES